MPGRRKRLRGRALFIAALLATLTAGCGSVHEVVVAVSGERTITLDSGGLGTVQAGVDVPVTVGYRDQVEAVQVRPGDHVTKGQVLLSLDPTPLITNAQAVAVRIQQTQAVLSRETDQLSIATQRQPILVPGIKAQIQALQSQLSLEQQLLDIARGKTATISSPIAGDINAVNVFPGQFAAAGHALLEIVDFTRITVTASLPVTDQPDVTVGLPADVSFTSIPNLALSGTVLAVAPGATNNGLSFQVVIDAANTPDKRARPGFRAYVRVKLTHVAAVAVPKIAVLNLDLDPTVFVIEGQTARRRQVEVGVADGTSVEILRGVAAGERCVIAGSQPLADGSTVRVTKIEP